MLSLDCAIAAGNDPCDFEAIHVSANTKTDIRTVTVLKSPGR